MGKIESEKSTVTYMIGLYCRKKHKQNSLCLKCEELKALLYNDWEHVAMASRNLHAKYVKRIATKLLCENELGKLCDFRDHE